MIKIENLTKIFGTFKAVNNISLEIPDGEIFGFLGPNGAGKTTTVKILSGILMPTSGKVLIAGYDIVHENIPAKRCLAYIPDEPYIYPKLTGYEFMRFIGDIYSIPYHVQIEKIPPLLEMFELSRYSTELVESYSHGMKQKLLIASVLMREPRVVLFDEPTVGLDPKSVKKFKDILFEIAKKGTTIFMCTHILDMAEKLCDRVGIIYNGKLIALGSIDELKKNSRKTDCSSHEKSLEDIFLELTEGT